MLRKKKILNLDFESLENKIMQELSNVRTKCGKDELQVFYSNRDTGIK